MIDFSGYTKQAIEADMLAQVDPNIDTREGSMVQTAVGACAYALEGFYLELDKVQKSAYSQTAQGESLDLVAKTHSTIRIPATPAVRQGTFLDDNSDPVTIPVGSRFKTINGEDSVVFVSGDLISAGVYELTCETPGIIGNSYSCRMLYKCIRCTDNFVPEPIPVNVVIPGYCMSCRTGIPTHCC